MLAEFQLRPVRSSDKCSKSDCGRVNWFHLRNLWAFLADMSVPPRETSWQEGNALISQVNSPKRAEMHTYRTRHHKINREIDMSGLNSKLNLSEF